MDEGLETGRARTKAEMRDIFVQTILRSARFWTTAAGTVEDKLLGLGFSFLVMLDGGHCGLPAFVLVPVPHEEDEAFNRSEGNDWWPTPYGADRQLVESFGLHEGRLLHDLYSARREPGFLVWWTTQAEAEVIGNEYGDGLVEGIPEYIRSEWASRRGRAGRGRLWIARELTAEGMPNGIETPGRTGITRYLDAGSAAGIAIRAKDVGFLRELPGLVTTLTYERFISTSAVS